MDHDVSFGTIVRRRRELLRLTRSALAERVHCSEATIKKIERDERRPSAELAALLAAQLLIPDAEREAFRLAAAGERSVPLGADYPPPPRAPAAPADVFVARERELAYLQTQLQRARSAQGRVVFVTGSAGSGKSALARAVVRRSLQQHADMLALSGACAAYIGVGDPYLPFREQLDLITGEVALAYETTGLDDEAVRRLWELLPFTCDVVFEQGADLIGTLRSGTALAARLAQAFTAGAPVGAQMVRLQALLAREAVPPLQHERALFTQYTRVLQAIAAHRPLILVIDDLQWADEGTLSLLFHLGRRLANHRILLIGLYRPLEPPPTAPNDAHPLQPAIDELQRLYGTQTVDLGNIDRKGFVDALIDSEPNQIGAAFRTRLYRQTAGHALFTVETLREMQERGVLVRNSAGAWIEHASTEGAPLPARAEAVIRERLGRLPADLRALLTVASIEGEGFTLEVVAAALERSPAAVSRDLEALLAGRHHLIDLDTGRTVAGRELRRFRFRHNLFQMYLYNAAGDAQRKRLHGVVGATLERLYTPDLAWVAAQLAHHYLAADAPRDAVRTLQLTAESALRVFAIGTTLQAYNQAIALAEAHPEAFGADDTAGLYERRGRALAEAGAFAEAVADLELALQTYVPGHARRREVLTSLGMTHRRQDNYAAARATLTEAVALARAADDAPGIADILYHLGTVAWSAGDNAEASAVHEEAVTICRREGLEGIVAIQAFHGWGEALVAQAKPNEAIGMFMRSLELARAAGDRSYEAENLMMLGFASAGFCGVGAYRQGLAYFDEALAISRDLQLDWHTGYSLFGRGQARGWAGDYRGGVADLTEALSLQLSGGAARYRVIALDFLGELMADLGEWSSALTLHKQSLLLARESGVRYWEPRQQANCALAELALGNANVGAELAEALARARRNRQGFLATRCLEALAALELARGAYDSALAYADQFDELARLGGMADHAALAQLWRGRALAGAGQHGAAEAAFRRAAEAALASGRLAVAADAYAALGALYAAEGRIEAAAAHQAAADVAAAIQRPSAEAMAQRR